MFNLRKKITGNAGSSAPNGRENLKNRFHKKQGRGLFLETQAWSPDGLKAQSLRGRTPSIFLSQCPFPQDSNSRERTPTWLVSCRPHGHLLAMRGRWSEWTVSSWRYPDSNQSYYQQKGMHVGQLSWQLTVIYVLLSATCEVQWLPLDILKVGNSEVHLMEGKRGLSEVKQAAPRIWTCLSLESNCLSIMIFPWRQNLSFFHYRQIELGLGKLPGFQMAETWRRREWELTKPFATGCVGYVQCSLQGEKQRPR